MAQGPPTNPVCSATEREGQRKKQQLRKPDRNKKLISVYSGRAKWFRMHYLARHGGAWRGTGHGGGAVRRCAARCGTARHGQARQSTAKHSRGAPRRTAPTAGFQLASSGTPCFCLLARLYLIVDQPGQITRSIELRAGRFVAAVAPAERHAILFALLCASRSFGFLHLPQSAFSSLPFHTLRLFSP